MLRCRAQVVKLSVQPSKHASFPLLGSACLAVECTMGFLKEVYTDFRTKITV